MGLVLTPEQQDELESELRHLKAELSAKVESSEDGKSHETRLRLVTAALGAIQADEYGTCKECEEPIGYQRLKERPESLYCESCQAAREKRR